MDRLEGTQFWQATLENSTKAMKKKKLPDHTDLHLRKSHKRLLYLSRFFWVKRVNNNACETAGDPRPFMALCTCTKARGCKT